MHLLLHRIKCLEMPQHLWCGNVWKRSCQSKTWILSHTSDFHLCSTWEWMHSVMAPPPPVQDICRLVNLFDRHKRNDASQRWCSKESQWCLWFPVKLYVGSQWENTVHLFLQLLHLTLTAQNHQVRDVSLKFIMTSDWNIKHYYFKSES